MSSQYIKPGVYVKEIDLSDMPRILNFKEFCGEMAELIYKEINNNKIGYTFGDSTITFYELKNNDNHINIWFYDGFASTLHCDIPYTDINIINNLAKLCKTILL